MTNKTIQAYLIVDWKQGATRTRTTEPSASELGTNELVTPITLDVIVPEVQVEELSARIEVPEPRVIETDMADRDAQDIPGWQEIADEYLAPLREAHDPGAEWLDERDAILVEVLQEAPGRPDIEDVSEYCERQIETAIEGVAVDAQ